MKTNFFISNDFKLCDLCQSSKSNILIDIKGNVMTSDHQVVRGHLKKIECENCGLVRSGFQPNTEKLKNEYQTNYEYNSGKLGDMIYFSPTGFQDRSSHTLERILNLLSNDDIKSIETIVEVGCGEGNLIKRFKEKFPNKKFIGFEINEHAIKNGKKKGLDIRPLKDCSGIKADLIISYAVIEHTPSPKYFIQLLSGMLNQNGIMIIGAPHQDNIFYDIFFVDHLFHFSTKHLQDLARFSNLKLIKKTSGFWPINSIVLCLFKFSNRKLSHSISYRKTKVTKSIKYYNEIFKKIDHFLSSVNKNNKLAIFGLGEVFCLFYAYTNLQKQKISLALEDFPTKKFAFPVFSSQSIKKNHYDIMMFCVNPNYYSILLKRLKIPKNKTFLPFKN